MSEVFSRRLSETKRKALETQMAQMVEHIGYMQESIEDFAAVTSRKLYVLEQKVKELENG